MWVLKILWVLQCEFWMKITGESNRTDPSLSLKTGVFGVYPHKWKAFKIPPQRNLKSDHINSSASIQAFLGVERFCKIAFIVQWLTVVLKGGKNIYIYNFWPMSVNLSDEYPNQPSKSMCMNPSRQNLQMHALSRFRNHRVNASAMRGSHAA